MENKVCSDTSWREGLALCDDEILFHLDSMAKMTDSRKIQWKMVRYSRPSLFVMYPDLEEKEARISQNIIVEAQGNEQLYRYEIDEILNVPSGLLDIHIQECVPDNGYETRLSLDGRYEYLTTQEQVLKAYRTHPVFLYTKSVMKSLQDVNFKEYASEENDRFSIHPLPAELDDLQIVKQCMKFFEAFDAQSFHALATNTEFRKGLGIKD